MRIRETKLRKTFVVVNAVILSLIGFCCLAPMLNAIRAAVGLDHFGLDLSLRPDGELLVFEANACMNVLDNTTIPPPNMWETPIAAVRGALAELHEHSERWLHPGPLPALAEAV